MATDSVIAALQQHFPQLGLAGTPLCAAGDGPPRGQWYVRVAAPDLLDVCFFLRDDPRARLVQLVDLTCVDYLNYPGAADRFGVTYNLLSHAHHHRLWLKVFVNDPDPVVPSVTPVWRGAEWMEREVYDMFGIRFTGHPDLRRILMPANFESFPLRKDYPVQGRGERDSFDVIYRDSA